MANGDYDRQKEVIKEIIRDLHAGLSFEEARERLEAEVGSISSYEIARVEQSLIDEGMSPDEIKKFCNVHALLFESSLRDDISGEETPGHPVTLFKDENREIEKLTGALKELSEKAAETEPAQFRAEAGELLVKLKGIELHYTRKEQLLFPYLERYGFMGPSQVMWGKHNEIRDLYKQAAAELENVTNAREAQAFAEEKLNLLIDEVEGMIFKEENILFPTSLEKLQPDDWFDILRESGQVGYAYIEPPADTAHLVKALKDAAAEEAHIADSKIKFPSGSLSAKQLMHILNALPVDLTFVDRDDVVRYFSENRDRIFVRTRAVIGRRVENCHPPQSVEQVEKIVNGFKDGSRDSAEFWINMGGEMIYIVFYALRDQNGTYLGALEVAQDITKLRELEGERRLLDEGENRQ